MISPAAVAGNLALEVLMAKFLSSHEAAAALRDLDPEGVEMVMIRRAGRVVHLQLQPRLGRPVIVDGGMKTALVLSMLEQPAARGMEISVTRG